MLLPLILAGLLPTGTPVPAPRTSYAHAVERVFRDAHPRPPTDAFSRVPELGLALAGRRVLGAFGRITTSTEDFRDDSLKAVHRWGVCGEARWEMDGENHPFGGLFMPGTSVPAIIRMATGTNRNTHMPMAARTWGLAIKLFPSQDPDEPVVTQNISLSDLYGLDGQARPHFLQPLSSDPPLFFSNQIRAQSPTSIVAGWVLGRFDRTPLFRSVRSLGEVDMHGQRPFNVSAPSLIQLHARHSPHQVGDLPGDYRDELMAYAPGELVFDVVLPAQPSHPRVARIGTLTVGRMVMSPACDGALQFAHPPTPLDEPVP